MTMLGSHGGSIAGAIVGVCVIYILSRYANGLGVFAIGNVINETYPPRNRRFPCER